MSQDSVSRQTCLRCGNNPINHTMCWIDSVFFFLFNAPILWVLSTWLGRLVVLVIDGLFKIFLWVGTKFKFCYFGPLPVQLHSDRAEVLATEALSRGYTVEALRIFGRIQDTYRFTLPYGQQIMFAGLPRLNRINALTSAWMDDKWWLKKRLLAASVPVSRGRVVYTWTGAKKVFAQLEKPVIVKPRFGSRGRHSMTNINTIDDLRIGYQSAKQLGIAVMVEEHLYGSVYRATCVNGKLVGVLAGDPPRITGDGVSTIATLIEHKNATRPDRVAAVIVTEKHLAFLRTQDLSLGAVLKNGRTIDLSEKIGLSYGGSSREVTADIHPTLRTELERAARAVNDPLLGFDFISPDVTADPAIVRWGIIECNSVPFINLHHDPLMGEPVNVAAKVLDAVETGLNGASAKKSHAFAFFAVVAVGAALLPLLWYIPHFKTERPPLIGIVEAVDNDVVTLRLRHNTVVTMYGTPTTLPPVTDDLVGKRIMVELDGVKDNRHEIVSYRILQ